jgi:hypothetical protein
MSRRLQAILIGLFAFSTPVVAKKKVYYKLNHDSCRIKVWNNFKSKEDLKYKELVFKLLKERDYKATILKENKKIIAGDFHLNFTWNRSGEKLFKNCSAKVIMKRSNVDRALEDDDIQFEQNAKRSFPRHTPKGVERCERAIKDVFNLLPHCIKDN